VNKQLEIAILEIQLEKINFDSLLLLTIGEVGLKKIQFVKEIFPFALM
jgi:hypothetical protein